MKSITEDILSLIVLYWKFVNVNMKIINDVVVTTVIHGNVTIVSSFSSKAMLLAE